LEKISAKTPNPKLLQSIPGTCPILKQFWHIKTSPGESKVTRTS
jgi:hypothetical protein